MNYYPHHIGDYASATAHLTALEDCFYRRLLDWYYLDEKPIPTEARSIYRRVRASAESEREAVDVVLQEFFLLGGDGYRHSRCDLEIERSRAKSEERRNAANRRWNAQKVRPACDEQCITDADARGEDAIAAGEHANAMHSQEPITNNQKPKEAKKRAPAARDAVRPEDVPEGVWSDFLALRKAKRSPLNETALAGISDQAEAAGLTLADALRTCCQRGWQGFDASWLKQNVPRQQSPPMNPVQQHRRTMLSAIGNPSRIIDADVTEVPIRIER